MNLEELRELNNSSAFNRFCGFQLDSAAAGTAVLSMKWKDELTQYAGFLHAGVVTALIDTACGFAAATLAGRVLASHCAVNFLRPAVGENYRAIATVQRAGRSLLFVNCELFGAGDAGEKLVASGATILTTSSK